MSREHPGQGVDPTCAGLLPIIASVESKDALWDDVTRRPQTRADLRAQALAFAAELGTDRKKLVFLEAGNHRAAVVALLGIAAAGHALALVDPALAADKKARLLQAYRPDLLVTCEAGDERPLARVLADEDGQGPHADLFVLLSTSGTTGSAKFVRLSYGAILANARQIASVLEIGPASVAVAHLPMHYSYGLSVVTSHLVAGGGVAVIDDAITSPSFWAKVSDGRGTHFPGVPFHYVTLARLGFTLVPPGVDTFTQAGGALDQRFQAVAAERITERGGRFFVMYGQTEAAPRMTTLPHQRWAEKRGSVGLALPGGSLSVLSDGGEEVGVADATGPLVYRGPNVMMGYAEARADLALGDTMEGRLETGDIGRIDAEGYLYLNGRTKRFAKIAGLRLGLDEIEREIGSVLTVACLEAGDKVVVCFEGPAPEALKGHLRAIATEYKIPTSSFTPFQLDALPRNPSGKVDYAALREAIRVRPTS